MTARFAASLEAAMHSTIATDRIVATLIASFLARTCHQASEDSLERGPVMRSVRGEGRS